jgi:hypothetical protein
LVAGVPFRPAKRNESRQHRCAACQARAKIGSVAERIGKLKDVGSDLMTTLLLAKHDNKTLPDSTLKTRHRRVF